jgi:hypothetical protein
MWKILLKDMHPFHKVSDSSTDVSFWVRYKVWNFYLDVYMWDRFWTVVVVLMRKSTLFCWKCAWKFWQGLCFCSHSLGLVGQFYNLLPVALWVKKIAVFASTNCLKVSFLVKSKPFVCLPSLPIFVSRATNVTHLRRCCLAFKRLW